MAAGLIVSLFECALEKYDVLMNKTDTYLNDIKYISKINRILTKSIDKIEITN